MEVFIKVFLKKIELNYSYWLACVCILLSMSIGVFNESLVRQIANLGIISPIAILTIRQTIYTLLTLLIIFIRSIRENGYTWYKTKYFYMHLLRGTLFLVAANCWTMAITSNKSSTPLYLVYYVALVIPTLNILFSELLLGEKVHFLVKLLCVSSACPMVYYLLTGKQVFQISLLIIACALYSLVDCISKYISTDKPLEDARIRFFIKHEGKERDVSNNFYNAITLNVLYIFTFLIASRKSCVSSLIEGIVTSFTTPWIQGLLLVMGIASFLTFLLPLQAMKRTSLSSLQPLKILEPVMAGVFFDHKSIPIEILIALLLFLCGSIFGFINELRGVKEQD